MASEGPPQPATSWPVAAVTELVVPETARACWEIRGYSLLDKSKGVKKNSPTLLEVAGARFFTQLYIGGYRGADDGQFSLYCCRERDETPSAAPVSASFKLVVVGDDTLAGLELQSVVRTFKSTGQDASETLWGWHNSGTVQELERRLKGDTLVVGLEVSAWASGREHEWKLPAAPGSSGGAVAAGVGDQKRAALAKDLAALFGSGQTTDVEVSGSLSEATDQPVKAHRLVLAARSPVFSSMLQSGMRESEDGARISLEGADNDIAQRFLRFLYTDELDQESLDDPNVLCHLLALGHRFDVQPLVQLCSDRVTITEDTAIDRLVMAEQLGLATLKEQAKSFACSCRKRLERLRKTEAFARMIKNQPQLMDELLAALLQ